MISLIAAIDKSNGIGKDNQLLVRIKEDMEWFKKHTHRKSVVMGRKTYESIGKPLPKRHNIVLTHDLNYNPHPDVFVINDIKYILNSSSDETMVIGGQTLYEQFLPYADRLYLTHIHHEFEEDSYFPQVNAKDWLLTYMQKGKDKDLDYTFCIYDRKQ